MLNKELSHFAESGKSGTQISEFIFNTFMDREQELDLPTLQVNDQSLVDNPKQLSPRPTSPISHSKQMVTSVISKIPGVRRLRHANSLPQGLPKYGIESDRPEELAKCMEQLDVWGLDLFKIGDLTKNHPMATVIYSIFQVFIQNFQVFFKFLFKFFFIFRNGTSSNFSVLIRKWC